MSLFYLFMAIILEVAGTICMKLSNGFTKVIPSILVIILYLLSIVSLTFALKKIDVTIAYAIWAGLGTALTVPLGLLWFKEPVTALKMISLGMIIIGVIGLNLSGGLH